MSTIADSDRFVSLDDEDQGTRAGDLNQESTTENGAAILRCIDEDIHADGEKLRNFLVHTNQHVSAPPCSTDNEMHSALSHADQLLQSIEGSSARGECSLKDGCSMEQSMNTLYAASTSIVSIEIALENPPGLQELQSELLQIQTDDEVNQTAYERAKAGGIWKRGERRRLGVENIQLFQQQSQLQHQLAILQRSYDQCRQSCLRLRARIQSLYRESVRKHFRSILTKEKKAFGALMDPVHLSEWNEKLLQEHVCPTLEEEVAAGHLTDADAQDYRALLVDILHEGYDDALSCTKDWKKTQIFRNRLQDFCKKSHRLADLLSVVSANSRQRAGDEFYAVLLRLLVNAQTKERILCELQSLEQATSDEVLRMSMRESAEEILEGYDEIERSDPDNWGDVRENRSVDINTWSHTQIPMDGMERWTILKRSAFLQSVFSPEIIDDVEQCIAEKLGEGYLLAGGRESWDGTKAVAVLGDMGNPHAIPYILELFEQSGTGHTSSSAAYQLERLLQEVPPSDIAKSLAEHPKDMQDIVDLLRNGKDSYCTKFSRDGYSVASLLQNRKRTLRQEQIAAVMEREGTTPEELESFYMLRQNKTDLLSLLRTHAASIGMQESDLVEEYFDDLTSVSLEHEETPTILLGIADALGVPPAIVFERIKQKLHVQENCELNDPLRALRTLSAIADAIGQDRNTLVEEYLPDILTGVSNRSEHLVPLVREFSNALGEPSIASLARIQPTLEGNITNPIEFLATLRELSVLTGTPEKDMVGHYLDSFLRAVNRATVRELPDALAASLGTSRREIMRKVAEQDPRGFAFVAERNDWRGLHGEEVFTDFLSSLPTDTDEKRNAFTHNPYDRTSEFMGAMKHDCPRFDFCTAAGMKDITEYVKKFGLSKTGILFQYFHDLRRLERNEIDTLPEQQRVDGVTTMLALEERVKQFQTMVYGEQPLMDARNFNDFEREMLAIATNQSAHRFGGGRPSLQNILANFSQQMEQGLIAPAPPEYSVSTFSVDQVHIDFEPEKIEEDFGVLSSEILRGIEHGSDLKYVQERACSILKNNISELDSVLTKQPHNRFIQQQLQSAETVLAAAEKAKSVDEIIAALLDMQRAQAEKYDIASVIREALFHKFLEKHYSPAMIQNLQMTLSRGATPQGVLAIVDVVQNSIKDHILRLDNNNQEQYWTQDCWEKIEKTKGKKSSLDLRMVYEGRIKALKEEAEHFKQIATGARTTVRAIPDRGLIGAMSGYLANACYTAEYPLLVKYPNVVPVKFVSGEEGSPDAQLIGSLLYFEIETEHGKALLARAFNVPNEADIDIHAFIEQNLDRAADIAKQRGCTHVLVPGLSGAISNYPLTNNHIHQQYITGKTPLKLTAPFAFNNYDLTQSCYVARYTS